MSRARMSVAELAQEAKKDIDDVLLALLERGINVLNSSDIVPRAKLRDARRAIGLSPSPDKLTVAELARDCGEEEEVVRCVLVRSKIISEGSTRVPNCLAKLAHSTVKSHQKKALEERVSNEKFREMELRALEQARLKEEERVRRKALKKQRAETKAADKWPVIGHPSDSISFLTAGDVEAIHWELVKDYQKSRDPIDPPGLRTQALLDSAVFRPHTALGQELKYPSIVMASAALFHALVHDHCFHNGNKRTAVVALLVFLDRNGSVLPVTDEELFDYVLKTSNHSLLEDAPGPGIQYADRETLAIARWLQARMKQVRKGELCIKFRELRQILSTYGCTFAPCPRSSMDIFRDGKRVQVWYGGEGRDVEPNTIHKIRHDLGLDENHGYDSDIFYNASSKVPDFINKYRKTLDRLAKM